MPGNPGVQVVMYFRASDEAKAAIRHGQTPDPSTASSDTSTSPAATEAPPLEGWQSILHEFWQADQEYCDSRFKVIPCMVQYIICTFLGLRIY